jgi:hypothetical protein
MQSLLPTLRITLNNNFSPLMKKLYFVSILALASFSAGAQCVINQSVFSGPTDYRILPDTVTGIPSAYVGTPYSTDLQFHVAPDTVTPLGTFPIDQIQIDSIVGIPAGFTYSTNPVNGTFPGGSYGCANFTGQATAGQEGGGPNSDGVYPVIIYFTATVSVFSTPTQFPATKTGYKLHIMAANTVPSLSNVNFTVSQNAPNPSDKSADFLFTNPTNGNVQFTLYNILGETVKQNTISATKGDNHYILNTADLSAGVYLYTFRSGNATVTRRMTVSH